MFSFLAGGVLRVACGFGSSGEFVGLGDGVGLHGQPSALIGAADSAQFPGVDRLVLRSGSCVPFEKGTDFFGSFLFEGGMWMSRGPWSGGRPLAGLSAGRGPP